VLKVVAADSGAAILNEQFEPLEVVACVAVLVGPPYRKPSACLAEPLFASLNNGHRLIIHELKLCQELLKTVKADVVHLDMSLGAKSVEELSPIQFSNTRISGKVRSRILKIFPGVRRISADVKRVYGVDVLAIGKDSVPVRIAELTAGAYAVVYCAEKVVEEREPLLLGLPVKCEVKKIEGGVVAQSLSPAEHDISGFAKDEKGVLNDVVIHDLLNPCARGFRALKITPRKV